MNLRLVARLLGIVAWLIGGTMVFSLPWAHPAMGAGQTSFELRGFVALAVSMAVCGLVGLALRRYGRDAGDALFRKEAMAVVGLSWVLATALGALPYFFADVGYRLDSGQKVSMGVADCLFESQSGFSTTGATVLTQIENKDWVPRCILFWRSSTHFLGGLGIIVLFVAVLGQGSAGKALMRAEMPGPSKDGSQERMQQTAWIFAGIYVALNAILAIVLKLESSTAVNGVSWFEALCHAFGAMATGGFSTMDASLGGFQSRTIEYTVLLFMILAGSNFTLLYFVALRRPMRMLRDVEWRTYIGLIVGAWLVIAMTEYWSDTGSANEESYSVFGFEKVGRDALFQVASVMTTTGFGTSDFDAWSDLSRAILFCLMFVGGCAGSTGGGMKVIRHVLFLKIVGREFEQSYHPAVVRHIRLGDDIVDDPDIPRHILTYVGLVSMVFVFSWLALVAIESDSPWSRGAHSLENKLIDSAGAVAATLNNIGPGLGVVGPTENYSTFSAASKVLFTLLMMLGRLELFPILVLILPGFWRER